MAKVQPAPVDRRVIRESRALHVLANSTASYAKCDTPFRFGASARLRHASHTCVPPRNQAMSKHVGRLLAECTQPRDRAHFCSDSC